MNVKNENVWYLAFECQVYDVFLRKVADRKLLTKSFLVNLVRISVDEVTMKRCYRKKLTICQWFVSPQEVSRIPPVSLRLASTVKGGVKAG